MLHILNVLFLVYVSACFVVIFFYSFISPYREKRGPICPERYSSSMAKLFKFIQKGSGFHEKSAKSNYTSSGPGN